eukprot:Nitzschia sp. Nitz4//scaffold52_size167869//121498//127378//NITZ4_002288-RA/size167869-snap-gene-0.214-mRNA-1//1//CDS//3329554071//8527//frame0
MQRCRTKTIDENHRMASLYDSVRASVDESTTESERVEVNQRALIDKILARYASAGAVYRELIQNSNDAEATTAEVHFTVACVDGPESSSFRATNAVPIVTSVMYRNNGWPFRKQDWSRLKKIAEGNPDETKIGAFGVGAYTMFSICEAPMVLSGTSALAFVWKGDSLWTKTIDREDDNAPWTSFLLPSRDPYALPDLVEFGEFLCASLTFTKSLKEIRVFVGTDQEFKSRSTLKPRMTITKTLLHPPEVVQVQKSVGWFKKGGAVTVTPNGLFSLKDQQSLLESLYHFQVELDSQVASTTARYLSGTAVTKIPSQLEHRMIRVTKKKPPRHVDVQLFLSGQQPLDDTSGNTQSKHKLNGPQRVLDSFAPPPGGGRIFIGFRTSQTTGLAAHVAAPFVPTVEREAMDLQDQSLRLFNLELLEFSGILLRLTLEHGMRSVGLEYERGAADRDALDRKLLEEYKQRQQQKKDRREQLASVEQQEIDAGPDDEETKPSKSSVWGFASFMAKGVKKGIVKALNKVEEAMDTITNDDTYELFNPPDPRPLCAEEQQAILLMQSFCPKQSTPDPLVGMALAQGFARCLPEKSPPVLTKSGVMPGDQARLPHHGLQTFCTQGVIRSIVYENAEEYHNVIARTPTLSLSDVINALSSQVLLESQVVRLLKWWVKFTKIAENRPESRRKGVELKEQIRFMLDDSNGQQADISAVYSMKNYLFYLDSDVIRPSTITGGTGNELQLPMPESVLMRSIEDQVGHRALTDVAFENWFSPLPLDIWMEFISYHSAITAGEPENEKLRLHILSTLSQEFARQQYSDRFGSFCQSLLKDKRCIPFDSKEPTKYCTECPKNLYLYSAELQAFDGIGNFHKASQSLKHSGVSEDFLLALGVRKSVAIDFLFANLDTLKWSNDPKPLIEYLRSATLTNQDLQKLHSTQYLPCENDTSRMFAPSELYLPDKDLRIFPFVRLLQWPSIDDNDELTERTLNGKFLVKLGMKALPPLVQILQYVANNIPRDDTTSRTLCLQFVGKRLGSGGAYQTQYSRLSNGQRGALKFLPCVIRVPVEHSHLRGLYSPVNCYSEARCGVMGFPVLDPDLGDQGRLFGSLFQVSSEPEPRALVQQLLALVKLSRKRWKECSGAKDRQILCDRMLTSFSEVFAYLSSRTSDFDSSLVSLLSQQFFVPYVRKGLVESNCDIDWCRPEDVFFKSENPNGDYASVTETLFRVVAFSPFLALVGVKQEASTQDIFRLMIESPQRVFESVQQSEGKYRSLLRRVAAHRPFTRVTSEMKASPFLLAYEPPPADQTLDPNGQKKAEKRDFKLAKAEDIHIIDNSFFGRMFPVQRAPPESDLEDFYALMGSPYISKHVKKTFDVVGTRKSDTKLALAMSQRIHERSPLLVAPSVMSSPLVPNATSVLDEINLSIYEVPELISFYSLGPSVRSQQATCCSQPSGGKRNVLYVTKDFDWFDVGFALGELILVRCQLENAFFISSLLEAPLEQLRNRGFPVDRIIKPEPIPEPAATVPQIPIANAPSKSSEVPHDGPATENPSSPTSVPENDTQQEINAAPTPLVSDGDGENPPERDRGIDDMRVDDANEPSTSREAFVAALKQMYPDADEGYILDRLGPSPTLDDVSKLAEEMAAGGYPQDPKSQETKQDKQKPLRKLLGSKKLGRVLRGGMGSTAHLFSSNSAKPSTGSSVHAGAGDGSNDGRPVPPEVDAVAQNNMERMLEQTVSESSGVDLSGVSSSDKQLSIPQGLDRGPVCEAIPGQNLKPFPGPQHNGKTHNGILVFSARLHPSSEEFLRNHYDVVESFAVVIKRLCIVYDLPVKSVCIFHDPSGGTIAFNSAKALHFNVRFFFALHFMQGKHQSRECYSYWYVTTAHELAHHMVSGHNKEHGFYTESYISLYLPKLAILFGQLEASNP